MEEDKKKKDETICCFKAAGVTLLVAVIIMVVWIVVRRKGVDEGCVANVATGEMVCTKGEILMAANNHGTCESEV